MRIVKRKRLNSPKLRDAPRHECCVMCERSPCIGVAHLPHNEWGQPAGTGQKTDDWCGAHLCQDCHDYADGPGRNDHAWRARALCATLHRLFVRGVIVIPGEEFHATDDLPF